MTIFENAYCLCGENLVWEQNIAGQWTDITNNFVIQDDQTSWAFFPSQQQLASGSIDIRYRCGNSTSETTVNFFNTNNDFPDIMLTKVANPTEITNATVGETITYTFVVTNSGNIPLTNIQISDPGITVTGSLASLPAQATDSTTFSATYSITAQDIAAGMYNNTATVTAQSAAGPVNDSSSTTTSITTTTNDNCGPVITLPDTYNPFTETPCVVDSDPISWSGNLGDTIDLQLGSCDTCIGIWQKLDATTNTWVNTTNPNGQTATKSLEGEWRICCDPGVSYSQTAIVIVNCVDDVPVFDGATPPYNINLNLGDPIPDQNFACCEGGDYFPQFYDDSDPFNVGWVAVGANNFPTVANCQWTYTFNGTTNTINLNGSRWRVCCPDGCSDDFAPDNAITINIGGCP